MRALNDILRDLPIQRKISLAILLTSATALAAAVAIIFVGELVRFKKSFVHDIATTGIMMADNCTAALAFDRLEVAEETLGALKAKPQVIRASIRLPDGVEFAVFRKEPKDTILPPISVDGLSYVGPYLVLNQPIVVANERLGTLCLVSDYRAEYYRAFRFDALASGAVLIASALLCLLLSNRLERRIAAPIIALTQMAQRIAAKKDYTLRAEMASGDEVGRLAHAFNEMLREIEGHAAALHRANLALAAEVAERTKAEMALQQSRQRYEVAVLGSSDGLWDWDLVQRNYYFSPRCKTMIGCTDQEFPNAYESWESRLHPDDREKVLKLIHDYLSGHQLTFEIEFRFQKSDGQYLWILSRGAVLRNPDGTPTRFAGSHTDISRRKQTEEQLDRLHRDLMTASRQAGMAEVATGVLHNVGNVLNSINVSATLVLDKLRKSEVYALVKLSKLFEKHASHLGEFLTADPKGKLVPRFLSRLAEHMTLERTSLQEEHEQLVKNIEHVKEIVSMQQNYAQMSGLVEMVSIPDLLEDALEINEASLIRHGIQIVRQYQPVPKAMVDKHKVLQILVNLIQNAKHALVQLSEPDKKLTVGISINLRGHLEVRVADNGIGIKPDNLTKIFSHGFTTRKDGHGFGLHSGANAAKEMSGTLTLHSDGEGKGAAAILELPLIPETARKALRMA